MKQIMLIFCLGFILNSCTKEPSVLAVSDIDANIIFNLKIPGSISRNPPTASRVLAENIDDITILIFEGDGNNNFLYRRTGISLVGNQFTATILLTDKPVKIHIFANPNDNINLVSHDGQTESEVISSLTTDLNLNDGTDAFPMHGILSLPDISEDIAIATDVYLLRAVALVDININSVAENIFELKGASVHNTPNTGRWISDYRIDENDNPATPIVTAPSMPNAFTNTIATPSSVTINSNKMENQLFIYENSVTSNPFSRIVVAGIFNSNGTIAYYPVDFTASDGTATDVLRNHKYTVNVTTVTGSGYSNELDAANGESIDMDAEIIAWNSIVIDGDIGSDPDSGTILNAPSSVVLNYADNNDSYTRTVTYKSNEDVQLFLDGVEVPFPGNNTPIDLAIESWIQMWLETATWTPTNNLEGEFEFTHHIISSGTPEDYKLTLKSGGVTRNMSVIYGE